MSSNADLRRADWRFLLPCPGVGRFDRLVLLGGPESLPDLLAKLGLARNVSRKVTQKGWADALVLLDDAGVDLAKASLCLARGGAVYWEVERRWSSFWRSTPGAIRRRLLKAGLTPLAVYWPRPGFRRTAMYLPIDVPGLLGWYAETLLQPATFGRKAIRVILRLFATLTGSWSFCLAPRYAVTAVAGPRDRSAFLLESAVPSGVVDDRNVQPVVVLGGRDASRRVIIFPFSAKAKRPSVVVKFWRLSDRNGKTETEQATLRDVRSRLDDAMSQTLPRPLGTARWGEIVTAAESYAPGPSLSSLTNAWGRSRRRKTKDLKLVIEWISEFHKQAQVSRNPWDRAALQLWVEKPISNFRTAFGIRPAEERLLDAVQQRGQALLDEPLPIVFAHPDLTGANIHVQGRQITVIDWSGTVPRLPLYDLLYFVMLWAAGMERDQSMDARLRRFRKIFILREATDIVTGELRESTRRYLKCIEIDSRFFPVLAAMAWVVRSLECHERERAVARGEPGANPHPGESYVEYVHLLAENSDRLFSESPLPWWMT